MTFQSIDNVGGIRPWLAPRRTIGRRRAKDTASAAPLAHEMERELAEDPSLPRGIIEAPRADAVIAIVLVAGLVITGLVTWNLWSLNDRNESRLLDLQTRQAGVVLSAALPSTQTPLATAMQIVAASGGDVNRFTRYISSDVGKNGTFTTASLWQRTGTTFRPMVSVGTADFATQPQITATLSQATGSSKLIVGEQYHGSQIRLTYAYALRGTPYAMYAEHPIPASRRAAVAKNSAFSELNYAIYLGKGEHPANLLTTSFSQLPPTGRTSTVTVPWGNTVLTMVATPSGTLGGTVSARLPWISGALGILLSIVAAMYAEQLVRRRRFAEAAASQARHRYGELESVFDQQRVIAETLQRALLPRETPDITGMEAAVQYVPGAGGMEIGGDWYSIIATKPGQFTFVVGDVSGRGLSAASAMAALRFAIRAYALEGFSPTAILEKCSSQLDIVADGHFATVLIGVGDVERHELTLASAGHLNPLVIDSAGPHFIETKVGLPLGVSGGTYESVTVTLEPESTLVAFTDGLVERHGESLEVGLQRLRTVVEGDDRPLEDLLAKVISELTDETAVDDVAMLALRWKN